jgi:transposase-like protein
MNAITEQQTHFLQLRAKGKTYDEIAVHLGVSRRTLFYWNQQLQEDVRWEEVAELESLQQELLGTRQVRARYLTRRLIAIDEELEKRPLASLSTGRLLSLADSLRRQILKETTPGPIRQKLHSTTRSLDQLPASECKESAKIVQSVSDLSTTIHQSIQPLEAETTAEPAADAPPPIQAPDAANIRRVAQCNESAKTVQSTSHPYMPIHQPSSGSPFPIEALTKWPPT